MRSTLISVVLLCVWPVEVGLTLLSQPWSLCSFSAFEVLSFALHYAINLGLCFKCYAFGVLSWASRYTVNLELCVFSLSLASWAWPHVTQSTLISAFFLCVWPVELGLTLRSQPWSLRFFSMLGLLNWALCYAVSLALCVFSLRSASWAGPHVTQSTLSSAFFFFCFFFFFLCPDRLFKVQIAEKRGFSPPATPPCPPLSVLRSCFRTNRQSFKWNRLKDLTPNLWTKLVISTVH